LSFLRNKYDYINELIESCINLIDNYQPSIFNVDGKLITIPSDGEVIVIGDIHGDIVTLKRIFEDARYLQRVEKNEKSYLVCLGDYIDRGPAQIEVMYTLLKLLQIYPGKIILLRGNHEGPVDIKPSPHDFPSRLEEFYGFYGSEIYGSFRTFFEHLYTGALVEGKALLVHGGIPTEAKGILDIAHAHEHHPEKEYLTEILWNDPSPQLGIHSSPRGIGKLFGIDIAKKVLKKIDVEILIRGHEPCDEGYYFHNDTILTVFSCKLSWYRNKRAAYLRIPINRMTSKTVKNYICQI